MTWTQALILFATGTVAGFINVVAGGGSLLTMPTLIFLGLPSAAANGTNRIALVGQNLTAVLTFRNKGFRDLRLGLLLGAAAVVGAVGGALIAIEISDQLFKLLLSAVMVLVIAGMLLTGNKQATAQREPREAGAEQSEVVPGERVRYPALQLALFVLVGIYGGFIQAGVGYLVIFALSAVGGLSLVRTNSIKVIVIGLYMVPSLVVFVLDGKVDWPLGLVLTVGNSLGAWLGTTFSVGKGDRWIRAVLVLAVLGMAGRLAGLY